MHAVRNRLRETVIASESRNAKLEVIEKIFGDFKKGPLTESVARTCTVNDKVVLQKPQWNLANILDLRPSQHS